MPAAACVGFSEWRSSRLRRDGALREADVRRCKRTTGLAGANQSPSTGATKASSEAAVKLLARDATTVPCPPTCTV